MHFTSVAFEMAHDFKKNRKSYGNFTTTAYGILASTIYNDPQVKGSNIDEHFVTFPKKSHTFACMYVLHCFYHEVPNIYITASPAMI
jgi:hypothetical protein